MTQASYRWPRFWTLMLLMLMVGGLSLSAQSLVTNVQQEVSLRSGPGTEWRRITALPVGTAVALDGRSGNAVWVRGIAAGGEVGWMVASALAVSEADVNNLPIINREAPLTVSAPGGAQPSASAESAPQANQPAPASVPGTGGVTAQATANVNVRSGPGTTFNRVDGLRNGQTIRIDGRDPDVGWVRGIVASGTVGWVSARYISLSFNEVATLPIVARGAPFGLAQAAPAAETQPEAPANNAQPLPSTAPLSGFAYGGHVQNLDGRSINALRQAGMTWVKKQIRYNQGQDPGSIAGVINNIRGNGFRVMLGVVGSPNELNNPGYFEQYASFVGGLAAQGVDAIEIWNEPNLDREWPAGQIDPTRYTQLLAQAYNAIKANNPNTLVISGAPAPTGAEAAFPGRVMNDDRYLAGMAAAGAANYMDCIGAHYNEGIVSPNQTSGDPRGNYYTRYFPTMVNVYYNAFGGSRPVCFTELGYLSPEGFGGLPGAFSWAGGTSVAQQALWLDQAINRAANSGRVRLVIVWNVDFTVYGSDPQAGYAIVRPDGSCPACAALGN